MNPKMTTNGINPQGAPSQKVDQKLLAELIEEGLRIQHRFKPEPIYSKTGKGYLKPSGVEEIQAAKAKEKKRS